MLLPAVVADHLVLLLLLLLLRVLRVAVHAGLHKVPAGLTLRRGHPAHLLLLLRLLLLLLLLLLKLLLVVHTSDDALLVRHLIWEAHLVGIGHLVRVEVHSALLLLLLLLLQLLLQNGLLLLLVDLLLLLGIAHRAAHSRQSGLVVTHSGAHHLLLSRHSVHHVLLVVDLLLLLLLLNLLLLLLVRIRTGHTSVVVRIRIVCDVCRWTHGPFLQTESLQQDQMTRIFAVVLNARRTQVPSGLFKQLEQDWNFSR